MSMFAHRPAVRLAAAAVSLLALPGVGLAASATWTGLGGNNLWDNDANWTAAHPDGSADVATFNNAGNGNTLVAQTSDTVNSIVFDTANVAAYTIGTVGSSVFLKPTSGTYVQRNGNVVNTQTINSDLQITQNGSNNPAFRNDSAAGRLIFNGNILANGTGTHQASLTASNNNSVTEFNGNFGQTAGTLQFEVQGGTAILNGNNAFQTATSSLRVVSNATLIVNGTNAIGGSNGGVNVNNTAKIGGTGSITGNLALQPSGTGGGIRPGDGSLADVGAQTGTLDVSGNLTFNTNAATEVFGFQIGGNTAGDGQGFYDQLNVVGSVALKGTNAASSTSLDLGLVNGYAPQTGDVYYLITRGDAAAFTTFFSNYAEGDTFALGGGTAQFTYAANWTGSEGGSSFTGGNDIAVRVTAGAIPEPAGLSLLAAGAAAGLLRRRRGAC